MTNSKQIFIEKASVFVNTTQTSQLRRRNSTQKALVSLTGCGYVYMWNTLLAFTYIAASEHKTRDGEVDQH